MRLEGQRVGRYYLLQLLGSGGMGEVYLAEDRKIEQQVAIKVVRSEVTPYPDARAYKEASDLFMREVKAIAKLDHPNILPLYDYGEEHIGEEKITYIVMPFRREGSLSAWLRQRSAGEMLSLQDVAYFLLQAADALQHAHDNQIIHQDVKPSNFLLRSRKEDADHPYLLLADFGVAKFSSASANASATIRGTPTYMAPEQWRGRPVFATDQYALGVMIYQLLAGHAPFQGGMEQIMYKHLNEQPPPVSTFNARIPFTIGEILLRALSKNPDDRFPSVSAFARAYQQALQWSSDLRNSPQTPVPPAARTFTEELRATLAISMREATFGTVRTLTLPGGQHVRVPVQAGAYDGQIIRLDTITDLEGRAELAETVIIKLAVVNTIEVAPPVLPQHEDTTYLATRASSRDSFQTLLSPDDEVMYPAHQTEPVATTMPDNSSQLFASSSSLQGSIQPVPNTMDRRRHPMYRIVLLVVFVVLIIVGGIGGGFYITKNHLSGQENAITPTPTPTPGLSQIPYAPYEGRLVFNDSLVDNSRGHGWTRGYTKDDVGTDCSFSGRAYHVVESNSGRIYYCIARNNSFNNFAFQIQMAFVSGSESTYGGIFFRSQGVKQYFFRLGRDGTYLLKVYTDDLAGTGTVLKSGSTQAIHTSLNVPNILAVVAQGGSFGLYVNQQFLSTVSDTTYSQGQIGVVAEDESTPVDIAFSNAEVWSL